MNLMNHNSTMSSISVFLYTTNAWNNYPIDYDTNSEIICQQICKNLEIKPLACPLFSLRISENNFFLPGCTKHFPYASYDFRLRFQVNELLKLKGLDKNAYNYLYHQVKWDLVNERIPELAYPNHKDKVVGLIVTDMYINMLEYRTPIDELEKNFKKYVPGKYLKSHKYFIKPKIAKELKLIKHVRRHDIFYVKTAYLQSIAKLAPNYFVETCPAIAPYLPEDGLEQGTCPVELKCSPFCADSPGLSIFYSYNNVSKHISKIEDIFAIIVDNDNVTFEMRSNYIGFSVKITDKLRLESFVSCITGYYRLMSKWAIDLCQTLQSPLLQELLDLKCHGPIGGEFSYIKLQEKQSVPGSYIIRQCEKAYDIYYIDIITATVHPETFKITKKSLFGKITWNLHTQTEEKPFNNLTELANSIKTVSAKKLRMGPSQFDKAPLLLLCLPKNELIVTKSASVDIEIELRQKQAQIINPSKELRKYITTQKLVENGKIKQMRADWILPSRKKVEVTAKVLVSKEDLTDFMRLAEKWSCVQSNELIKLYGFTLSSPYTMIIESTRLGPLDALLLGTENVFIVCLIDAAYSLARALYYLQENNIIHGKIRCASLQVIKYNGLSLVVRLGDPGFQNSYTELDLPWIPSEYHICLHRAATDFKAEVFAYATTLWEIFSKGVKPPLRNNFFSRRHLPRPKICPKEIYNDVMLKGWEGTERQFTPQIIFSTLISAREAFQKIYTRIEPPTLLDQLSTSSKDSANTVSTDQTPLFKSEENISHPSSENEQSSINSNSSPIAEISCIRDDCDYYSMHTPTEQLMYMNNMSDDGGDDDYEKSAKVIELGDKKRLVYHDNDFLGKGQYGTVYKGILEYGEDHAIQVAIKKYHSSSPTMDEFRDIQQEIYMMQRLNHPNIVKIKTWTDDPYISIVMEFVIHGSFLKYLILSGPSLTIACLLKFAKDIASGMEYLASKNIVHRDLAARNVLIDSDEHVKISDFGLSRFVNDKGYYTTRSERFIPYKWYSPETLTRQKYSFQSDIWSYGVTLFEMFSKGKDPNLDPSPATFDSFIALLLSGKRLSQPELCTDEIYNSLLMVCWDADPEKRPTFKRILVILNDFIAEYGELI